VVFESYVEPGHNYRMTDIQAAIGREQLQRLPEIVARRRVLAERYRDLLSGVPGLTLPEEPEWARSNWQSYCVRLPEGADQREVMQRLLDRGISTRRGIMCAHREPALSADEWIVGAAGLSESERAQDHGILLPLFFNMTEPEQDHVARELGRALGNGHVV
jgi:perosamine synthetase